MIGDDYEDADQGFNINDPDYLEIEDVINPDPLQTIRGYYFWQIYQKNNMPEYADQFISDN